MDGMFQVQGISARLCHLHGCVAELIGLISRAGGYGLPNFGLDCVLLDAPMQNASTSYLTSYILPQTPQSTACRRFTRLGFS